ncbi:MAG: hypothetical protein ABII82_06320 [Verrucomicrobiota bacterium]
MFARVLLYCTIPLSLVLAWVAWDRARIEVDIAAVEIGEAVESAPARLTLERLVEINVNTDTAGRVVGSALRTGQTVKEGEVLFEIAPAGKSGERVAVTAAFDGVITQILARPGEAVPAFAPLARLWNGRPEVVANVAPEHFADITAGLEAEAWLPNVDGWVAARVLKVPGYADDGGDFRVVLGLDLAPEHMTPGLVGEAVILKRRIPDARLIPAEAVQADGTVLVVDGKRVRRVAVTTGKAYRGQVQVTAGLTIQDLVVLRSAVPLSGGERIRVRGY